MIASHCHYFSQENGSGRAAPYTIHQPPTPHQPFITKIQYKHYGYHKSIDESDLIATCTSMLLLHMTKYEVCLYF